MKFAALRKGARLLLPASVRTKLYKIRTKFARSKFTMLKMEGCGVYMRRFGRIRGLVVYGKLMATDHGLITFSIPQANSPINLRPRTSDIQVFEEIFLQDEYRIPVAASPRLIIDGGANIGLASLYFAKQYPDAQIIAVEPELSNIQMLKVNTAGYPAISVLEAGIWHDHNPLKIENPDVSKCGFRLTQTESAEASVSSLRVDDILNLTGLDSIGILKLDIEGSEKEILQHSQSWIGKLEILAVELHDRYRPGCSEALYAAIAEEDFTEYRHDRTVILVRKTASSRQN
jgi:FkbM family methyltransferase